MAVAKSSPPPPALEEFSISEKLARLLIVTPMERDSGSWAR